MRKYAEYLLHILIFILTAAECLSMEISGTSPFVSNFTPESYQASNTNWSVTQDSLGRVWVANNKGLLMFNGRFWERCHPFGDDNYARIRSLHSDGERVWLGAYREFGWFGFDNTGALRYTSLSDKVRDELGSEDDIWNIHRTGNKVFFLYFNRCYVYDIESEDISIFNVSSSSCFESEGSFWLSSQRGQLYRWNEESCLFENPVLSPAGKYVLIMSEQDSYTYAVTRQDGLLKKASDKDSVYERIDGLGDTWPTVNCSVVTRSGLFVLGTIGEGVVAMDKEGRVKWTVNQSRGLQNNDVMDLYEDDCGNIWAALDKGVALIYQNGVEFLPVPEDKVSKMTEVHLTGDSRLLMGSNNGLYELLIDDESAVAVPLGPKNRIWSISEVDGNVFIGENDGTLLMNKDDSFTTISDIGGGTKMILMDDGSLVQATFAPVRCFSRKNGKWVYEIYVKDFYVPALNIEKDHLGNIWVEHVDQGIFRIKRLEDGRDTVESYPSLPGRDMPEKIFVRRFGGRVIFCNGRRFCVYDDLKREVVPFDVLNNLVDESAVIRDVVNDTNGSMWFFYEDGRIVNVNESDGVLSAEVILDCKGFSVRLQEECADVINVHGSTYMIPVEGGFLLFDKEKRYIGGKESAHIGLSSVQSSPSSGSGQYDIRYHSLAEGSAVLDNASSLTVSFYYAGCEYANSVNVSYILEGYDESMHRCTTSLSASYPNLGRGNYRFRAVLSDASGQVMDEISYDIVVRPSFWASWTAVVIYLIIGTSLVFLGISFMRFLLRRQRAKLDEIKEKEMMELRNRQLEEMLLLKSDDLAKFSLIEAQRNNILDRLRDKITQMRVDSAYIRKSDFWELLQIIDEGGMSSDAWGTFYNNFDLVHDSFFVNLSRKFPSLTESDLRYCAYLRLNMSTKEISKATGLTVKGVEGAKYRLRKKMNIPSDISITQFILNQCTSSDS